MFGCPYRSGRVARVSIGWLLVSVDRGRRSGAEAGQRNSLALRCVSECGGEQFLKAFERVVAKTSRGGDEPAGQGQGGALIKALRRPRVFARRRNLGGADGGCAVRQLLRGRGCTGRGVGARTARCYSGSGLTVRGEGVAPGGGVRGRGRIRKPRLKGAVEGDAPWLWGTYRRGRAEEGWTYSARRMGSSPLRMAGGDRSIAAPQW